MPPPPRPPVADVPPRPAVPVVKPIPSRRDMAAARAARKPKPSPGPYSRAKFTSRHTLVLYMDVAGESTTDIALKLDMHPGSISAIKGSPLYQVHKEQLLESLAQQKFSNLLDLIKSDSVRNVEMMIEMRDKLERNQGEPKHSISAMRMLQKETDRVYPRITNSKHTEERTIKISIDGDKMRRIATVLHEIGARAEHAIDAETVVDLDLTRDDEPALISSQSIDEARDALLEAATNGLTD